MRIAVVTPLFPFSDEPHRAGAIYKTVVALQRHAEVQAICPIALYPAWSTFALRHGIFQGDLNYSPPDIPTTYFVYPAFPLLSRPWNGAVCARRLYPHLAKMRPDVVLNYWLYPEGYASLQVAHSLGIPVIVGARGSDVRRIEEPITRMKVAKTLRDADYVLTVSEELRRHALRLGASENRSRAILNGCDPGVFQRDRRDSFRLQLGIAETDRVVLYVGRLSRVKGLLEVIQAFAALAHEDPRLRLVCVGEGSFGNEMISRARAVGMEDRMQMPGNLSPEEVARWMTAADLFCFPSYSEGCPNVLIEAISAGCPVVASDVGGIPELVTADCGILVPPRNKARLATALREALARVWDHHAIGSVFSRTWDDVAEETYEICKLVAGTSQPAKARKAQA